jgi:Ca-activated chloride channel family protein
MARATKAGDPIADPILSISVASDAPHARRVREPLWIGRDPDAEVVVPAGHYIARVENGLASRDAQVTVAPGSVADAQLVLGAGRLELSTATQAGGEPLGEVTFAISEDDPEAPGGRREIARSAAPLASFVLPAGTYYVSAASGAAEARDRIAIGAGGDVKHTVVLNVGRAVLAAQLDGTAPPKDVQINFRVLRVEDQGREVARSTNATPAFLLSPGRYRFEAQLAGENVRAAADVDIAAGKEFRITLKLESAQVTVRPAAAPAGSSARSHWEVKDGLGRTVLRSGLGGTKTARLAPGRYLLRSDTGTGPDERAFDLKPGEQRTIDLTPH